MKHIILHKLLKRLQTEPQLLRKVKILAIVSVAVVFISGGLLIWAGISAAKYVVAATNQSIKSPEGQQIMKTVNEELKSLSFQPVTCWGKTQSLFSLQPWIERPVMDNIENLKAACFESSSKEPAPRKENLNDPNQV